MTRQETVFAEIDLEIYQSSVSSLVAFSDLQTIPFTSRVLMTSESTNEITTIVQHAWQDQTLSNVNLEEVTVTIVSQEEYLQTNGEFVYVLLYAVKLDDMVLSPAELPVLDAWIVFRELADKTSADGNNYVIPEVNIDEIWRFKSAMSIYINKWVTRADKEDIVSQLKNIVEDSIASVELMFGTQEYYQMMNDDDQSEQFTKFSFFATVDSRVLESFYEPPITVSFLQTKLSDANLDYTVLDEDHIEGALNLRYSYKILVEGGVAMSDLTSFSSNIQKFWENMLTGATVNLVFHKEFVDEYG